MKRCVTNYVMLTKIAGYPQQDTGVGFYRIIQPLRFLKREGLIKEARTIPFTGESQTNHYQWSDKTFMEIARGAQVIHTTLLWKQHDILRMLDLRKWSGAKWIVDLDDNIWASAPDNAATDQAEVLRPNRELCLSLADGVTVSVPTLKELISPLNPNVFVQPNGLDFKIWDNLEVKKHKKIRIGWRGALGHKQDLAIIRPVIDKLRSNYPNVEFIVFGAEQGFEDENIGWVSLQKYPDKLASLGIDIAVVPLIDSAYNRCKSNLNWQEWSALKIPVVYSPTENNKDLLGIAATTMYEWYEALALLISSKESRSILGQEQNVYLKEHFNMKDLVKPLAKWMDALPRRTDLEP